MPADFNPTTFGIQLLVFVVLAAGGWWVLQRDGFRIRWNEGVEELKKRPIDEVGMFMVGGIILCLYVLPGLLMILDGAFGPPVEPAIESPEVPAAVVLGMDTMSVNAILQIALNGMIIFGCLMLALVPLLRYGSDEIGYERTYGLWLPSDLGRVIRCSLAILMISMPAILLLLLLGQCLELQLLPKDEEIKVQTAVKTMREASQNPMALALMVIAAVVSAPLAEELSFRGVFLPFLTKHVGLLAAILTTSLCFALIHFNRPIILPLTALGIALAVGYIYTRSMLAPILMHAAFNAVNVFFLLAGVES